MTRQSFGICRENTGVKRPINGMLMSPIVCWKTTVTSCFGTSECGQTNCGQKTGFGDARKKESKVVKL